MRRLLCIGALALALSGCAGDGQAVSESSAPDRTTATTEPPANETKMLGPDHYLVEGTFDSQNRFGAMVRSGYLCNITDEDDDTWTLEALRLTR